MQRPPEYLLKLQTWELAHPYAQLLHVAVVGVFVYLTMLAFQRFRNLRALFLTFVALNFFTFLVRISFHQPLLGILAISATIGIFAIFVHNGVFAVPFQKMAGRKLSDDSRGSEYLRNVSNMITGLFFVMGAAVIIFGFIMVWIHSHK